MKSTLLYLSVSLLSTGLHAQLAGSVPTHYNQAQPADDEPALRQLLEAARPPETLRRDDVISVKVLGVKDLDREQTVSAAGEITLPLAGVVAAAGLTPQQLERQIAQTLIAKGMILEPQVTVTVLAHPSAIVTVSGHVTKPGTFPAQGDLTVLDYLSQAGAFNELNPNSTSASDVVTLLRPTLAAPVRIPLGPDPRESRFSRIRLFAGDTIVVGRVGTVYAVGAFKTQGGYPLKAASPTSILELVALAGGVGYEADLADAHLVRTSRGDRVLQPVNVAEIIRGKAPDVALSADDILFVPSSRMRAAIKGGGSGIIVSLATAFLYAR